jgi:hypothetical protein
MIALANCAATQPYVVTQQSTRVTEAELHAVIRAANPAYSGMGNVFRDNSGVIWGLDISGSGVSTLEPLRGMQMTAIACTDNTINDLSPLVGMKLLQLACDNNPIADLSPISGMPIWKLSIKGTKVTDLGPLEGMKLRDFVFSPENITKGIDIVRNMKTIMFYPAPVQASPHPIGNGLRLVPVMRADKFWELYDKQYGNKAQGTSLAD